MSHSIIYLGLDVHKDSITIAVLPESGPVPSRVERLQNDVAKLRRLCNGLAHKLPCANTNCPTTPSG